MAWEDRGRAVWHQDLRGNDADPHDGSDHAHRNTCGLFVDFACLCSIDGGATLGGPAGRLSTVYRYHAAHKRAACGDRTRDRTLTKRMLHQLG